MSKETKLSICLYLIVVALYLTYAVVQNQISTTTYTYSELQQKIYDQKAANSELYVEYLRLKTLGYLDNKARSEGFVDAQTVYFK